MEIRFSKYNSPFCEPHIEGVHYISLDHQRDMWIGRFSAHVALYFSLITYSHLRPRFFVEPAQSVVFTSDEIDFLQQLSHSGIKAANRTLAEYWDGANE